MKSLAALLVLVALAPVATATTDGRPQRIKTIGSWRQHDPVAPQYPNAERWTPRDVVGFLSRFPDSVMDGGYLDGFPPGDTQWRKVGALIGEARTIAGAQGVPFEGRMCVTERPDVMLRSALTNSCNPQIGGGGCDWEGDMDGEFGEAETVVKHAGRATAATETSLADAHVDWTNDFWRHRLLVLRPGPGEERRRIVGNTATALSVDSAWLHAPRPGDRYEIRGSFDPAWVQRVSRSAHEETVQRLWAQQRNVCGRRGAGTACKAAAEPLDPLNPANQRAWPNWIDRAAIAALATPTEVPALYGPIIDGVSKSDAPSVWLDPYFSVSAVVMNVADPAYREWRIRYLMYKLRDHALSPGAPACVLLTYKPGWYTFRDEAELGASPDACATPGSNLWTGPAHICTNGSAWGGPFVAGLYQRGEFEGALNAYVREALTRLAQRGWTDVRLITTERPNFGGQTWSILADDVRRNTKLLGEWDSALDPPLSLLNAVAADPKPAPPGDPNPATPARPKPAPLADPNPASFADPHPASTADPNPVGDTPTAVEDTPTGSGSSGSTNAASEAPANAQPDSTPARQSAVTKSRAEGRWNLRSDDWSRGPQPLFKRPPPRFGDADEDSERDASRPGQRRLR